MIVETIQTQIKKIDEESLAQAKELLLGGGLVAFPTETVYGLGADARSDTAVESIYRVKGRPSDNPLVCSSFLNMLGSDWHLLLSWALSNDQERTTSSES